MEQKSNSRPTLYILCGPAGCGKSTWAKKHAKANQPSAIVSRDDIRFRLMKQDGYFAHEREVFRRYVQAIQTRIDKGVMHIYADATHLNTTSRRKLLNELHGLDTCDVVCVHFNTPLEVSLMQNAKREGLRRVPEDVIEGMYRRFTHPRKDCDPRYTYFIEVG